MERTVGKIHFEKETFLKTFKLNYIVSDELLVIYSVTHGTHDRFEFFTIFVDFLEVILLESYSQLNTVHSRPK